MASPNDQQDSWSNQSLCGSDNVDGSELETSSSSPNPQSQRALSAGRLTDFFAEPYSVPLLRQWGPSSHHAIQSHQRSVLSFLRDFDWRMESSESVVRKQDGSEWSPPSPIQAFPARERLPGEQTPYRLADGAASTQPLRGRRRNPSSIPAENTEDADTVPNASWSPLQHLETNTSSPPPFAIMTSGLTQPIESQERKRKLPGSNRPRDISMAHSGKIQKQSHFNPGTVSSSPSNSFQSTTQQQSFSETSQLTPDEPWMPHNSAQLTETIVLPHDDTVWQPHGSLFAPNAEQDPPTKHSNVGRSIDTSLSPYNFPLESMQSFRAHVPEENLPYEYELPAYPHQNTYGPSSSVPSFGFASSSSQSHSLSTSSNASPPPALDLPHNAPQEHFQMSELPMPAGPRQENFTPGYCEEDGGTMQGGNLVKGGNKWDYDDLVDFGPDQTQE